MSLYIATLAELKADLGLADTTDDAVLTRAAEVLQGAFDARLHRTLLYSASVTEVLDGGVRYLQLRQYPIVSVSSVVLASDQDWTNGDILDASVPDYLIRSALGNLIYGNGTENWPEGDQSIRVIYAGGYTAAGSTPGAGQTAMPESLRRAFLLQLGYEWRNRLHLGQAQVSGQGGSVNLAPVRWLPAVAELLDAFERVA